MLEKKARKVKVCQEKEGPLKITSRDATSAMTYRRTSAAALAALALTLLCAAFPTVAHAKHKPLRSVKSVAKLERPVPWAAGAHVHSNSTQDTDVLTGVLALDGRYALVLQHQQLPQLAPIKTTFTVRKRRRARERALSLPLAPHPRALGVFRPFF